MQENTDHDTYPIKTHELAMRNISWLCATYRANLHPRASNYQEKNGILDSIISAATPTQVLDLLTANEHMLKDFSTTDGILYWYQRNISRNTHYTCAELIHIVDNIHQSCLQYNEKIANLPLFDLDDLSFFRAKSLCYRHVGLERGRQEMLNGSPAQHGDACSLANFGRPYDVHLKGLIHATSTPRFDPDQDTHFICTRFHQELKEFTHQAYQSYHEKSTNFNDAAFFCLNVPIRAQYPYDFFLYPLGKVGSGGFSPRQIYFMMTSERYDNQGSITHAVSNTLADLKDRLRRFKIEETNALLQHPTILSGTQADLKEILLSLLRYYEQDIFIESDIFLQVFLYLNPDLCGFGTDKHRPLKSHDDMLAYLKKEIDDVTMKKSAPKRDTRVIEHTELTQALGTYQAKSWLGWFWNILLHGLFGQHQSYTITALNMLLQQNQEFYNEATILEILRKSEPQHARHRLRFFTHTSDQTPEVMCGTDNVLQQIDARMAYQM